MFTRINNIYYSNHTEVDILTKHYTQYNAMKFYFILLSEIFG